MPSQPVAAEWAVCAINKFVKSVSAQITSKMASRAHKMENLQCTSYRFSFVDVTLPVDVLFDVVHSAMGDRKVPRSRHCTSHAGHSALVVQCTESLHIFFLESLVCNLSLGSMLSAFRFSMAIWNDWKWKSSRQKMMHKSGNWTECYNWSAC